MNKRQKKKQLKKALLEWKKEVIELFKARSGGDDD